MYNWGDPWADNADNAKSPSKHAVTSPLPPSFAPAPAFLGGFVDDAGWGNEDESFGDWSTSTAQDAGQPAPVRFCAPEPPTTAQAGQLPGDTQWDSGRELEPHVLHDGSGWGVVKQDAPKDEEQVLSEASDSSTTVPTNEALEHDAADSSPRLQPDDDSSARTSTSPSETSHNDVLVESPRTSYEEERGVSKVKAVEEEQAIDQIQTLSDRSSEEIQSESRADDADVEVDADQELGQHVPPKDEGEEFAESAQPGSTRTTHDGLNLPVAAPHLESVGPDVYKVDDNLLGGLFAPSKEFIEPDDAPDNPIYSTSARKAWYRLTRKQTMREFNSGNDDDNYIRVTWGTSHIRTEVNKVVGRWAREDRLSGTGPGARASFYWDTPASIDLKATAGHNRQRSSVSATHPNATAKESLPALSTNVPAAFNWSSASGSVDPWHGASPGLRSTPSPITPLHPGFNQLRKHEARAVSLDLTSQKPEAAKHARTLTATHETPVVANLISPPIANITAPPSDPWSDIKTLDVDSAPIDDEDEWGEMVSSPTVSTPTLTEPTSQSGTRKDINSTAATTPQSIRSINIRDHSPDAMHAAPIVRLKSTISPTSALFKANSFIPLVVEQGPIGPGLLKSTKRAVSNPNRTEEKPPSKTEQSLVSATVSENVLKLDASDEFSEWQTSPPDVAAKEEQETKPLPTPIPPAIPESLQPSTPPEPTAVPAEPDIDAWADADFSFFESSLPTATPPQPPSASSDPFSVFETRDRSASAASSAKTFTRSPPRKVTPPTVQPLTGATSSAQRRKNEEDSIIHDIMRGLPDLSYMLR